MSYMSCQLGSSLGVYQYNPSVLSEVIVLQIRPGTHGQACSWDRHGLGEPVQLGPPCLINLI